MVIYRYKKSRLKLLGDLEIVELDTNLYHYFILFVSYKLKELSPPRQMTLPRISSDSIASTSEKRVLSKLSQRYIHF